MQATQAEHVGQVHAHLAAIKDAVIKHNAQSRWSSVLGALLSWPSCAARLPDLLHVMVV